jgi:predicted amidohydrolase YtcJ
MAIAGLALVCVPAAANPADIVFHHGRIHTEDPARSQAAAIAIAGDRIVAVGDDQTIDALIGPKTRVVDLAGRVVLPGFIDAHIHPAESAQDIDKCSLDDKPLSVAEVQARIRDCLAANPGPAKSWFAVVQVNPSGLTLTRHDLDAVLSDRPLALSGSDGHTIWGNSAALKAAGVTRATPDPAGGRIEREASGDPAGALRDNAAPLLGDRIPQPGLDEKAARLARAFAMMSADGITSVQDARVDDRVMAIYKRLYDTHRLKMRVRGTYHLADPAPGADALIAAAKAFRTRWAIDPDFLRADAVKIFADGVVEYPTRTAALLAPYLGPDGKPTDDLGPTYFPQDAFNRIVALADAADLTVHVHAIGDRAVRSALDAFAYARRENGVRDNRDQIAHLELVDPQDYPRFKALNVIANFQLDWAMADSYVTNATLPVIGAERAARLYPARSLADAGAVIAGGSDWNVSTFDPFEAMERAITRREGKGAAPLAPDQSLTLQTMVDAYTINAAFALKQDRTTGSLEPGKLADLIVLDRDIFAIDPYDLSHAKVLATYLGGKPVYRQAGSGL